MYLERRKIGLCKVASGITQARITSTTTGPYGLSFGSLLMDESSRPKLTEQAHNLCVCI